MDNVEVVDDQYWLQYGKKSVENAISTRNEGAAKLEKMILWFWGIYTTTLTIGVSIRLIDANFITLILLASPIFLLVISYFFAILAQLPVHAEFDPAIPYEIKEAHVEGLLVKKQRFSIALYLTFAAALVLGLALFLFSILDRKGELGISAEYDAATRTLVISGTLPKLTTITTRVDSLDSRSNSKIQFFRNVFKTQKNGVLNLNVPLTKDPEALFVTTTWMEGGKETGFVAQIKN